MVNYQPHCLDGIFAALADPTRRAMLTRLSTAPELSVTALARPFAMSLPAVLKHLDVLEGAGLILRHKRGRTVSCRLSAAPLREAQRWLADYEQFWARRLDALEHYLASEDEPEPAPDGQGGNRELPGPHAFGGLVSPQTIDATTHAAPNPDPTRCPPPSDQPRTTDQASPSRRRAGRRRSPFAPGPPRKP